MSDEERKKRVTISNDTFASNPGEITFKPLVWFKHKTPEIVIYAALAVLSIWLTIRISGFFGILAFLLIAFNVLYWLRSKEHFTADSNAGLVISEEPKLVAVSTNLTKFGGGSYPVIKIIEFRVKRKVAVGERIPTVAIYTEGGEQEPHWKDFYPEPVEYATDNQAEIEGALATYPDEQWQAIERGLAEIEKPYKPGLYRVEIESSDWEPTN